MFISAAVQQLEQRATSVNEPLKFMGVQTKELVNIEERWSAACNYKSVGQL